MGVFVGIRLFCCLVDRRFIDKIHMRSARYSRSDLQNGLGSFCGVCTGNSLVGRFSESQIYSSSMSRHSFMDACSKWRSIDKFESTPRGEHEASKPYVSTVVLSLICVFLFGSHALTAVRERASVRERREPKRDCAHTSHRWHGARGCPREIAPREIAPRETAAREIAARKIAAREIAAQDIAAWEIAAREIAAREIGAGDGGRGERAPGERAPRERGPRAGEGTMG